MFMRDWPLDVMLLILFCWPSDANCGLVGVVSGIEGKGVSFVADGAVLIQGLRFIMIGVRVN